MNLCQKMAILNELVDVAKRRRNELKFFFGGSTLLMHGRSECPKLIRPLLPPRVGPTLYSQTKKCLAPFQMVIGIYL